MFHSGLVSISFRNHSPRKIALKAKKCGLRHIEWGSDTHAPCQDISRLHYIRGLQIQYKLSCCSYGTYFRLGLNSLDELHQYIQAANVLGTNILRLWAGRKKQKDCTEEDREHLFSQCRQAAALAEENGMILCLECHRRSYTETKEGALELMRYVNSPNFRMYWQPNPDLSVEENLDYITALQEYITHIHVFHWRGTERLALAAGTDIWEKYLSALDGDHHLLLEFMPDDQIQSLEKEATALHKLIKEIQQ